MNNSLLTAIRHRIEQHNIFHYLKQKHPENWNNLSTKEFQEVAKKISHRVIKYILDHPHPKEILQKLGITDEYLQRKYNPNSLPNLDNYDLDFISSTQEFLDYFSSNPHKYFPLKSERTIRRIWFGETNPNKHTYFVFFAFLEEEFSTWEDLLHQEGLAKEPKKLQYIKPQVRGVYQFYNRERIEAVDMKFQRAQLILTQDKQEFVYRTALKRSVKRVQVFISEELNQRTFPIKIRGDHFEIKMYINLPARLQTNKLYAHYIYQSTTQQQYSSMIALQKVENESELLPPERDILEVPILIKKFLSAYPILTDLYKKTLFDQIDISGKGKTFQVLKKYIGVYYLYCSKNYEYSDLEEPNPNQNRFLNWVGRDVLEIFEGDKPNQLLCKLKTKKHHEKIGEVLISDTMGTSCIIFNFTQASRFLNMIFYRGASIGLENFLLGTYNTEYESGSPVGCGLSIIKKISGREYNKTLPGIINPMIEEGVLYQNKQRLALDKEEKKIVQYLCFRDQAYLGSLREKKSFLEKTNICKFMGVYKVYAYGRMRNKEREENRSKVISIGALEISPYHYIRHKGDFDRENADGWAKLIEGNLFLTLINKVDGHRTGTFFIRVQTKRPKPGRIYCGTFSGVSPDSGRNLGNRIVLEYCPNTKFEDIETKRINIYDPSIQENVDPRIRKALIGRWVNFISFYDQAGIFNLSQLEKENTQQLQLGENFFHSACYKIVIQKKIEQGIKDLQRALEHGFGSYQIFEKEIQSQIEKSDFQNILRHPKYLFLKDQYPSFLMDI